VKLANVADEPGPPRDTRQPDAALKFALTNNENQLGFAKAAMFYRLQSKHSDSYFKTLPADASSVEKARLWCSQPTQAEVLIPAMKDLNVLQSDFTRICDAKWKTVDQAVADWPSSGTSGKQGE